MAANIARRKVNEIRKIRTRSKHGSTVIAPLKDPRIVKLPKNAWLYFIEENRNLPPYADISKATDRIKEMSKAYRSLSESQKKVRPTPELFNKKIVYWLFWLIC